MIKLRNQQELEFQMRIAGTLAAAATVLDCFVVPCAGYIKAIYAVLGTAGTTNSADIQKNGTSIAASGNELVFGANVTPTYAALTTNPMPVAKGDTITLSNPVETGGTAANLSVIIVISKRPVAATEFGTISGDFDTVD